MKDELKATDMSRIADIIVQEVEQKAVMFRYEFRESFLKILIGKLREFEDIREFGD